MATNDYALMWRRKVRGLIFAEHAILDRIVDFYDRPAGRARISLAVLCWHYESSRVYVRELLHAIQAKGFIEIESNFSQTGLQENNAIRLKLDQIFPKGKDRDAGLKILRWIVKDIAPTSNSKDDYFDAWIEELPKRHKISARPKLWIAVKSASAFKTVYEERFRLQREIESEMRRQLEIDVVKVYLDRQTD